MIDTSLSKLSIEEGLILLHLCGGTDGDVVAVRGHRNIVVCWIADRTPGLVRRRHKG
jgi:hypothetical protein